MKICAICHHHWRGWRLTLSILFFPETTISLLFHVIRHFSWERGTTDRCMQLAIKICPECETFAAHDSSHEASLNNNWICDSTNNFSRIVLKSSIKLHLTGKRRDIQPINYSSQCQYKRNEQEGREINSRTNRNNIYVLIYCVTAVIFLIGVDLFCYSPYCVLCTRITLH